MVDYFDSPDRRFYQNKDIIEFTEDFIQQAVPDLANRDISLFTFYSIGDRLYRIRTGEHVRAILQDKYLTNIATHVKSSLKNSKYDQAFKDLFGFMLRCSLGEKEACSFESWLENFLGYFFLFLILGVACFVLFQGCYECIKNRRRGHIQDKLRKRFHTLKQIKENKIDQNLFLQENCLICLDSLSDDDRNRKENDKLREVILSCGHNYHQSCIEEWNKSNTTCPLCRQNIS